MKPRRFDSETMVSRFSTDGPGSSTGVVGLAAVTVVSSGTGGRGLLRIDSQRAAGLILERLGRNSRTCAGAGSHAPGRETFRQLRRFRVIMVGATQACAPIGRGRDTR